MEPYRVRGAVHNTPFLAIVDFLLKGKPLKYTIDGKFINISKVNNTESQTETPKSGKLESVGGYVYDVATKEPVIGAQVRILGTNIATVTDVNGAFSFDYLLRGGESAQISYVGMKTRVVKMTKMMNIGLESDVKQVGEVVVTGIFRKAKESYTGAVSTVGKEKLEMFRGSNLLQTLKNVDASLNFPINNVAGSNPNVLPNLDIRGTSTLPMNVEEFNTNAGQTVNTPLIILDGFEISLTKLMDYNDDRIESINILKDAAATAIYGSRGANGVIIVVTKQPKEGRLRVTAKAGISLQIPDLSSYHLLHAADKLRLEKAVGLYDPDKLDDKLRYAEYYDERLQQVLNGVDIDWIHKPVHTGVGQNYNIRLDGGAGAFRWAASLGYNDIQGAMKGSSRKNLNGDITLMYSVKNLIFRNYTSVTSNHAKESKYGSFQDYVDMEPYDSPYDEKGNLVKTFYDYNHSKNLIGNPLYDASLNTINKSEYL
uniref:carboxypeptidase-like regulatory domain-containing protein n=1 Tax=Prevotella sp. TaxID=59823 RepID=UPI0040274A43